LLAPSSLWSFAPADAKEAVIVLVELGLVEQRYKAVMEVLDGATVVEVARRNRVARQTVHDWLRLYAGHGLAGLADRSSRPLSCPHQMAPAVEAAVVAMRVAHPGWGPRTILVYLAREGVDPLPARSSVYRCLVRHGLIEVARRKRRREDYRRWERSRAMELWQMDIVSRFYLADGTELHAVTGVDDHSRFCVCARLVARATARPVCDALEEAMRTHGVPDQILTDNGKVFTARFGVGPGPVLFDRICAANGVRHLLTTPRSPTTTGKVERFDKTWRKEFVAENDFAHARRSTPKPLWTLGSASTTPSARTSRWETAPRRSASPWPELASTRPSSEPRSLSRLPASCDGFRG
jgi:transposase InsO family protein